MKEILYNFNSLFQFSSIMTQVVDQRTMVINLKGPSDFIRISLDKVQESPDKISGIISYFCKSALEEEVFENASLKEVLLQASAIVKKTIEEERKFIESRLEHLEELDNIVNTKNFQTEEEDRQLVAFSELRKIELLRLEKKSIEKHLEQFKVLYNKELENFEIAKMLLDLISRHDRGSGAYLNTIQDYDSINLEALKVFFKRESHNIKFTKNIAKILGDFSSELVWKTIVSSLNKKEKRLVKKLKELRTSNIKKLENLEEVEWLYLVSEIPLDSRKQIKIKNIHYSTRWKYDLKKSELEKYRVFKNLVQASETGIVLAEEGSHAHTFIEKGKIIIKEYEKNNPDIFS